MKDTCLIPRSGRAIGVRNGNPLQYSCLENSMDRGAWLQPRESQGVRRDWAHIHRITAVDWFTLSHTESHTLNALSPWVHKDEYNLTVHWYRMFENQPIFLKTGKGKQDFCFAFPIPSASCCSLIVDKGRLLFREVNQIFYCLLYLLSSFYHPMWINETMQGQ